MFTVKEWQASEDLRALCDKLGAPIAEGDRAFVFDEDGPRAVGLLGLRGGKVIVKGVYGDLDEAYTDLMRRALLNVCRDFNPITVRVDATDPYWAKFGFEPKNGGMEVMSDKIVFCNH